MKLKVNSSFYSTVTTLTLLAILTQFGCASDELTRAKFFYRQNNWDKTATELNKVLDKNPNNAEAHYVLGEVSYHQNRYRLMKEHFAKSKRLSAQFSKKIDYYNERCWTENYNLGYSLYGQRNFGEAIKKFKILLILNERDPEVLRILGDSYQQLDSLDQAAHYYQAAYYNRPHLKFSPQDLEAMRRLAGILYQKGKYTNCSDLCEKIISVDSVDTNAWTLLALATDRTSPPDSAVEVYEKALRIRPGDAILHYNLALNYYELGKFRFAVSHLRKTPRGLGKNADVHYRLGECYYQLNRYHDALESFKRTAKIDPSYECVTDYLQILNDILGLGDH